MKFDNFEYSNFFTFRYDEPQDDLDVNPDYSVTIFTIVISCFVLAFMVVITASNPQGWSPTATSDFIEQVRDNIANAENEYEDFIVEEEEEIEDPFGDGQDAFEDTAEDFETASVEAEDFSVEAEDVSVEAEEEVTDSFMRLMSGFNTSAF